MSPDGVLGLKIDVDTYQGMKKGVPRLLESLAGLSVKGTFFLSMGPDASGLAVLQLFKNPRFLRKMIHTNAPGLYGLRTALYGTLLPSPLIALSFPEIVAQIAAEGHELQFHAWDHRRWQDSLTNRPEAWIRKWFEKGCQAFKNVTGRHPTAFGAPAWLVDDRVLTVLKDYPFRYVSCTRAQAPFVHEGLGVLEMPSDLPCFEEVGIADGSEKIMRRLDDRGIHVLPVHAEVEGGLWNTPFLELMHKIGKHGYQVETLGEISRNIATETLPRRRFRMAMLPGRSVPCCV